MLPTDRLFSGTLRLQAGEGRDMEPGNAGEHLLAVSVSTDRDRFMRRTCSSCGRDFKTEIDPSDLQWAFSSYCQRVGCEVGEHHGDPRSPTLIRCPYCGHE